MGGGAEKDAPLEKESTEGGRGGNLKEGDEGLWQEEEDGRRLSVEDWEVLEEALKDERRSEAMASRCLGLSVPVRETKLNGGRNMQEVDEVPQKDSEYDNDMQGETIGNEWDKLAVKPSIGECLLSSLKM